MTATGGDDVLFPALVRTFSSFSSITDLLAEDENLDPYIFQEYMQLPVETTGMCGIILWGRNGDSGRHTNYYSRRIVVDIIADPDRDPVTGNPSMTNATEKAWAVHREIQPILHRPFGEIQFDDLKVITSVLATGPTRRTLEDSQVMTLLRTEYEVEL